MQFKVATIFVLVATLASCAPVGTSANSLARRSLTGSIKSADTKLRNLEGSVRSTIGSVTGSWGGAAQSAAQNAANKVESALETAISALQGLDNAVSGGCKTYNNCENVHVNF